MAHDCQGHLPPMWFDLATDGLQGLPGCGSDKNAVAKQAQLKPKECCRPGSGLDNTRERDVDALLCHRYGWRAIWCWADRTFGRLIDHPCYGDPNHQERPKRNTSSHQRTTPPAPCTLFCLGQAVPIPRVCWIDAQSLRPEARGIRHSSLLSPNSCQEVKGVWKSARQTTENQFRTVIAAESG